MTFTHEFVLPLPIARVWEMFQDMTTLLPAITPPQQQMRIERAEPLPPVVGTELILLTKSPIGRVRWVARITELVPPHGTITGMEARFVDEQIEGPFKSWRHAHEFEAIDDRSTRCIDHIDYTLPYGLLGRLANPLIVKPALRKMFAYREKTLKGLVRAAYHGGC